MEVFPEERGAVSPPQGAGTSQQAGVCNPAVGWGGPGACGVDGLTVNSDRKLQLGEGKPSAKTLSCSMAVLAWEPRLPDPAKLPPLRRRVLFPWSGHPQPSLMVPIVRGVNLQHPHTGGLPFLHHRLVGLPSSGSSRGSEPAGPGAPPSRGNVGACGEPQNHLNMTWVCSGPESTGMTHSLAV